MPGLPYTCLLLWNLSLKLLEVGLSVKHQVFLILVIQFRFLVSRKENVASAGRQVERGWQGTVRAGPAQDGRATSLNPI